MLSKPQPDKLFTQKEAEHLSSLTRGQLRKLDETGLVVPKKHPNILYTWKQIILLKVLSELREDWSLKQLELAFKKAFISIGVKKFIDNLESSLSIIFLVDNEGEVFFNNLQSVNIHNDLHNEEFKKSLEQVRMGGELSEEDLEIIVYATLDCLPDFIKDKISSLKINHRKKTILIMPRLVRDLYLLAETLEIKHFNQKVG